MSFQSIYEIVPLGDVASFINGDRSTNYPKGDDYVDDGVPFISAADLAEGRIDIASVRRISQNAYDRLRSGKIRKDDVLFCLRGSIGKIARIRENEHGAIASSLVIVRATEKVKTQYLYFYLSSQAGQQAALGLNNGAAQPNLSVSELQKISFPLPPLPVQRRIAGILSAYDDLIENNQRRIAILERMARALYREWFVHFRYPGHEGVPLVDSPLGEIPQGWEVKTVANSFEILGGGTPSRNDERYWEGGTIQWFSPSDLTSASTMFMDDSGDHITELGYTESSARLFPAQSVMLTSRATIGAIAINTHEACTNQGFITCLPNERVPLYFLFHWVKENVPTFQRMASGATFKEISRGVFKTIEFLLPSKEITEKFEVTVAPIGKQLLTLQRQIQNLRRTRDLLLPRLLSGQLDVGELDDA
jgi:type I restriction enzyme S subunit